MIIERSFLLGLTRGYIMRILGSCPDREATENQMSLETPACQDMSLGAEELSSGTEASQLLCALQWS
jgi:hypothetical protein